MPQQLLGLPRVFWFLWVGALVNRLGGFVYPYLTLYLTGQRGIPLERAGLIVGLYGVGAFGAGPLGGLLADRLGRRNTLLGGFVLGAAAMLHLGMAHSEGHIALATFLLGLCGDLYRPASQAAIADVVAPADRIRAYGYLYWAVNLGFTGSLIIAGQLAQLSFRLLFIGDAATTLIFGLLVLAGVPETRPAGAAPSAQGSAEPTMPRGTGWTPYRDRRLLPILCAQLLVALVFFQSAAALPVAMRHHGLGPLQYGRLMAINGVMIIVFQPLLVGLIPRWRRPRVLALGAVLTGMGFAVNGLGGTWITYAASIVLWSTGELLFSPVMPTVVAELAPPRLRGSYQGALQLVWGTAAMLAPPLGMLVFSALGGSGVWLGCALLGLIAGAAHLLLAPAHVKPMTAAEAANAQSAATV